MRRFSSFFVNVSLVFGSALISLMLLEVMLVFSLPHFTNYYPWRPHMHVVFTPDPVNMPGIDGESHFKTNALGIRGDEIDDHAIQILATGGSTTECLYLDQSETWSVLLKDALNEKWSSNNVWIGNAGKSGHSVKMNILFARHLLDQMPEVDLLVVLPGVNDLFNRLAADDEFEPDLDPVPSDPETLAAGFSVVPRYANAGLPFWKRTRTWFLITKIVLLYQSRKEVQDQRGELYAEQRLMRQQARIRPEMIDLSSGLEQYRYRINLLINEAQERGVRILLLTQPSIWRPDLPISHQKLLWTGWAGEERWGSEEYYSVEAMADGMNQYNDVLLSVCEERGVECFDLASRIPKETELFYDDVHFTEQGAQRVAEEVGQYLIQNNNKVR